MRGGFIDHIHNLLHVQTAQVPPLLHLASDISPRKITVSKKCVTERGGVKAEVITKSLNMQLKESFSLWRAGGSGGMNLSSEWANGKVLFHIT